MNYEQLWHDLSTGKYSQWASRVVLGILALLLLLSIVSTVKIFFTGHRQKTISVTVNGMQQQFKQPTNLGNIAMWHLFGQPRLTAGSAALIPKTELQLKLEGLFLSSNTKYSKAVIASAGQRGKLYGIGDTIPGGAVIDQILPRSVIIRNNGRLERLTLPQPKIQFGPIPSGIATPNFQ